MAREGRLDDVPGIGKDLPTRSPSTSGKVKEIETTKRRHPAGVVELLNVPGIGPKTAKVLYSATRATGAYLGGCGRQASAGRAIGAPAGWAPQREDIRPDRDAAGAHARGRPPAHRGPRRAVADTVSKRTDIVVVGEEPGQKLDAARRLGIRTVDEPRFRRLLGIVVG